MLAPTQMERLLAPHGPYGRVLRPVRRQDARVDRLRAMRRLARPDPRRALLLAGLLHVRHQAGDAAERLPADRRHHHLLHGHPRLRQGLRGVLPDRQGDGHRVRQGQGGAAHRERRPGRDRPRGAHRRVTARSRSASTTWWCSRWACGRRADLGRPARPARPASDGFVDVPHPKDAPCRTQRATASSWPARPRGRRTSSTRSSRRAPPRPRRRCTCAHARPRQPRSRRRRRRRCRSRRPAARSRTLTP